MTAAYSEYYKKIINKICALTGDFLNVNAVCIHNYHYAFNLLHLVVTAYYACTTCFKIKDSSFYKQCYWRVSSADPCSQQ